MTLDDFAKLFDCSVPQVLENLRNNRNDFWRWWWTQFASVQVGIRTRELQRSLSVFRKVSEGIDVSTFLQEIDERPQSWIANTGRKKIGVQQHTDSIMLRRAVFKRVVGMDNIQTMMDVHETEATELSVHYSKLMQFLGEVAEKLGGGTLSRAMIVRLTPNKEVGRHWDCGYYYLCRDRYHLVLRSSGSKMECAGANSIWKVGELWWFNNNLWHSASNDGAEWRIHVIFDVLPHRNVELAETFKRHTKYYLENMTERV